MKVRDRFREITERHQRHLAADCAVMTGDAVAAILEALADHADHQGGPAAAVVACTYRDAADRARTIALDLAETIR